MSQVASTWPQWSNSDLFKASSLKLISVTPYKRVLLSRIFHQISVFIVLTTWASRLDNITFYLPKPQMYSVVRTCRNKRENTRSQRRLRICCHVLTSRWYYHTAVTPHASSCPGPKMEAGAGRSRQTRLCAGRRRQLNYTVLFKASVWNRSRE